MYDKKNDIYNEKTKKNLRIIKEARKKNECLFKNVKIKCDCNNDKLKTQGNHLIAKSKYLECISQNDEVMIFNIESADYYRLGRKLLRCNIKKAHKYRVLCGQHDKGLFEKIENGNEFDEKNKQQCFEFALRAFIFYYSEQLIKNNVQTMNQIFEARAKLSLNYHASTLDKFKYCYENSVWDALETYSIVLDKKIEFISCSCFYPIIDINNRYKGYVKDNIFFNIFPRNEDSIILISYFKDSSKHCKNLCKEIDKYVNRKQYKQLERYLSKMIIAQDKSITLNPLLWEKWSEKQQNNFYKYAHLFKKGKIREVIKDALYFKFSKPKFNLFDEL
ncbi:hypothetical protein R9X47_28675 [Wukongibacter baidiensis]|uniref:hypothetical protein n=1 Tax=Wukongibacter baidiensis TaxID=1723361 RepID=UPI003D7FEE4E